MPRQTVLLLFQGNVAMLFKQPDRFCPLESFTSSCTACLRQRCELLQRELGSFLAPADEVSTGVKLGEALTRYTLRWFEVFTACRHDLAQVPDLGDGWMSLLLCFDEPLHIGQDAFWPCGGSIGWMMFVASFADGYAEHYVLEQFPEIANALPFTAQQAHLDDLQRQLRAMQAPDAPLPHRAVYRGPANHAERQRGRLRVPRLLREQVVRQAHAGKVPWTQFVEDTNFPMVSIPGEDPLSLILHFFPVADEKETLTPV